MKRAKIDIVYDMLKAALDKGGRILPTHLLYKSNLSHQRMKVYIDELMQRKLLAQTEHKGKMHYEITDEGRKFVADFAKVKEFTQAFGL
ncbi:hypothetical protein C4580_01075 [Candidatus Woesearchaeota archaeon]|nr:MAG: hypothetical protein C4580_01075 [Candidatus Woesearchaeota archaeon]